MLVEEPPSFVIDAPIINRDDPNTIWSILMQARVLARCPVSNFRVGAVAIGASGKAYLGLNLEFEGQPHAQSVHAEQFAVTLARRYGETALTHLFVSEIPCGHCRQFLTELGNPDLPITVVHGEIWQEHTLASLLPTPFTLADSDTGLLAVPHRQLIVKDANMDDPIITEALGAAEHSYVPYTEHWSGLAIELDTEEFVSGGLIESGAYNPTLPALQAALIQLVSEHGHYHQIRRVCLVERDDSPMSYAVSASMLTRSLSGLAEFMFFTAVDSVSQETTPSD